MGIKNVVKKIGGKAGDKVAQLSSLSPAQVENVQLLREKYLLEMPNPNDPTAREQTERLMAASSVEIFIFQLRTKRSTEKNLMMRITFDI